MRAINKVMSTLNTLIYDHSHDYALVESLRDVVKMLENRHWQLAMSNFVESLEEAKVHNDYPELTVTQHSFNNYVVYLADSISFKVYDYKTYYNFRRVFEATVHLFDDMEVVGFGISLISEGVEQEEEVDSNDSISIEVHDGLGIAVSQDKVPLRPMSEPTTGVVIEPKSIDIPDLKISTTVNVVPTDDEEESIEFIDEDDLKQKSLQKMLQVREEVKSKNKEIKESRNQERLQVFKTHLATKQHLFAKVLMDFDNLTSQITKPEITADEFITQYVEAGKAVLTRAQLRALLEVHIYNKRLYMRNADWFKPTDHPATWNGQLNKKEELFVMALDNLSIVKDQQSVRPSSVHDMELYLHLLDYCERGSSLQIVSSPEDIVSLAVNAYEVFSIHNFNEDFIYAPDVNNHFEVNRLDWFKDCTIFNNLTRELLAPIDQVNDITTQSTLEVIKEIVDNRDQTMSIPIINYKDVQQIQQLTSTLPVWEDSATEGFNVVVSDNRNLIVLSGTYAGYDELVNYNILLHPDVVVNLSNTNGKTSQAFYTTNSAPTCIKFLMYTLNKLSIPFTV